jgi:hypothetical protein
MPGSQNAVNKARALEMRKLMKLPEIGVYGLHDAYFKYK